MGAYETKGMSDDWYTPKYIFDALGCDFDLDVSAPPEGPRYVPTKKWLSEKGENSAWNGFVWMNPPFGNQKNKMTWINRFISHGNGIALMPDRTSAPWWQYLAKNSDIVLFMSPKVKFERPDGAIGKSPGTGTCLFGIGERSHSPLMSCELGVLMR